MDCPRCGGPVDAYTLGGRRAATCERCGWVGVDAALGAEGEGGEAESWGDALKRVSGRRVTTARIEAGLPQAATADEDATTDEEPGDGDRVETIEVVGEPEVERLRAVGITTVEELATADPADLAVEADIAEADVRTYVRRAAIRAVTSGSRDG